MVDRYPDPGEDQSFWKTVTAGSISDAVISTDMSFIINGWNRAAETIYGWRAEEVLGKSAGDVLKTHYVHDTYEEALTQVFEQGRWRGEVLQDRRDGAVLSILESIYLARDSAGAPIGTVSVNIDITERRRAEEEIRRRTAHAEALVRVAARLNARLDLDAVLNVVCREAATALNIPYATAFLHDEEKEALYPAASFGTPADFFQRLKPVPRALADEMTRRFGPLVVIPNVQILPNMVNSPLYAEHNLRTLVDARFFMRDGTLVGALSLYVPSKPRRFTDDELNLVRGLSDLAAQAIHNARLFTAYKRSEDNLRRAQERLHHILVSSFVAVYSLQAARSFATTFISGSNAALLGFEDRVYLAEPGFLISRIHPEDRLQFLQDLARLKANEHHTQNYRFLHRDGAYRWLHHELRLVHDEQGNPLEIIGTWLDVTQRKQAEDETRLQTARAEALVRVAARLNNQLELDALLRAVCEETAEALQVPAVSVTLYDEQGGLFRLAATHGLPTAFEEEYEPLPHTVFDELTRKMGRIIIIPDVQYVPALPNWKMHAELGIRTVGLASLMRGDELVGGLNIFTFDEIRGFSQGELTLLQGVADQAAQAITNARLIEERKGAEAQLFMADRLASLGTLAAGIGHEINNPLAYVVTNLELVADRLARQRRLGGFEGLVELEQALDDARDGVGRIGTIVRDMKTFSRADEERLAPVDVREVLEIAVRMVINDLRHRARLMLDFGDVPLIQANESRLGQVFVNLLLNAAQSFSGEDAERNEIRLSTSTNDAGYVIVEVEDNGQGIPESVIGHIFDPFFTTKPTGTGLGLSICHSIVRMLGGDLTVSSTPDVGSAFRVVLPMLLSKPAQEKALPSAPKALRRSRILVVDDEPMIGRSLFRKLSPEHEVVALTHVREALDRLTSGEHFDLILCDLMMPEMSGMDLHAEVCRQRPEVGELFVFLSGGTFTARAREFLDTMPNRLLEKPFTDTALRELLGAMLGES